MTRIVRQVSKEGDISMPYLKKNTKRARLNSMIIKRVGPKGRLKEILKHLDLARAYIYEDQEDLLVTEWRYLEDIADRYYHRIYG